MTHTNLPAALAEAEQAIEKAWRKYMHEDSNENYDAYAAALQVACSLKAKTPSRLTFDTDEGLFAMTKEAADAWHWAISCGMTEEKPSEIFHTVNQQEVVSFCNNLGSVSFDTGDFVEL